MHYLLSCLLLLVAATNASAADQHGIKHAPLHNHRQVEHRDSIAVRDNSNSTQGGFNAIGYYVDWAIYARNFPPTDIQVSRLTHILYAFAGINNKTGEAYLTDPYADVQKMFPGDVAAASNTTQDLFGCTKQLYLLKKQNRNLKTLLSFGGWTLRTNFAPALTNSTAGRKEFAQTSVGLLKDLGFDGIDIDWEYPATQAESDALVDTCRLIRAELDAYAQNVPGNPHFLLTLTIPAGPDHFPYFNIPALDQYTDMMHLMAYDYMGSGFSNFSGNAQNVYKSLTNPRSTDFDTQTAIDFYLSAGLAPRKLNLGMPLYGRSFANTSGPGTTFTPATDGSWEAGVWDYKALPLPNSTVHTLPDIVASYAYGGTGNHSRYLVSYDTPDIARSKAQYIQSHGLAGAMWWETSGDRPLNSSESLIRTVTDYFDECSGLSQAQNILDYPESKYANLRAGMPGQ